MTRLLLIAAAMAGLAISPALAADPIEGIWQTEVDDGAYAQVTIAPCSAAFCGVISRTFNASGEYQSPNIGKLLVRSMVPSGHSRYRGEVWRPSNNKIYYGKILLYRQGKAMELKGCLKIGFPCSAQDWHRID
ncbi:MAG: DUF2147 domain-containing protein [Rhodobacteraceae bacterium]|nr:DUF2147 domain-containing protein [Paracoccaceae bacterium]